jgi:bla regulator protein BlaR1
MIPVALSIVVKVTVIAALALAAARLARNGRAAVRHVLLAAAFAFILVLPLASIVAPSVRIEVPIAAQAGLVSFPREALPEVSPADVPVGAGAVITPAISRPRWLSLPALIVASWIAGAAIFALPVAAGLWQIRTLRRSALPWRNGRAVVDPLADAAGIRRAVGLLLHESLAGPMTCGILRPAIVLPIDVQKWAADDLRRAIIHELEHVRRADWLTQGLARLVCAVYWFHPLVWAAWRQLTLEAERACDDAVLVSMARDAGTDASTDYADQLVVLAERLSTASHQPQLAMANRADLATRVISVLDNGRARGRAGASLVALAAAAVVVLVTAISPLRIVAGAQSTSASSADTQKFDVVSIRRCTNEPPTLPGQRSSQGGFPVASPGRFTFECGTVERLISTAYVQNGERLTNQAARIGDVQWLKGVPGWVRSEKYTIEAKAEGAPERAVMLGPMLRALLEDRFRLKIHRATDEAAMYEMTVARGGLKIQPIGEDGCTKYDADNPPGHEEMTALAASPKPVCGSMNMMGGAGKSRWTIGGTTMQNFAGTLSAFMDRHVIDKTGVEGKFNVRLEFARDENIPGPDKRPREGPPPAPVEQPPSDAPIIFVALEQQLGLKLESTKGPHGFLVIDHVERPSPNSGPAILETPARGKGAGAGR